MKTVPLDGTFVLLKVSYGSTSKIFAAGFDQEAGMWMRRTGAKNPYISGTPYRWMEVPKITTKPHKDNSKLSKPVVKKKLSRKEQAEAKQLVNTKAFWQRQSFGAASPVRRIDPTTGKVIEEIHCEDGNLHNKQQKTDF